jgi:photosystem II stability/assembly factor-like uncharacterized protein
MSGILLGGVEASFCQDTTFNVKYFNTLPHLSIRALEARSDSCAWFSANHGVWGYTEDAGKTWHIDSIKVDSVYPVGQEPKSHGVYPEFRSIAVLNDSTVLLLSIASPAYLFKTTNKGKTWRLVYKNTGKDIFFDSMKFTDKKVGMAIADPIGGHFLLMMTFNEGEGWHVLDSNNNYLAKDGESLFASSNTNMDFTVKRGWFATGGKYARLAVIGTTASDRDLLVYDTPIANGEKMTGIFSLDFLDDSIGVISGGNYEKTDTSIVSLAITKDGGKTWKAIKNKKPFFGSCVQFKSADTFFVTGHDGTFICKHKTGKISEVKDKSGTSLKFHTLRFSPSGKTVWFAGDKGRIAFINFAK